MNKQRVEPGDTIYAATELYNDGSIPELFEGALLASSGTRGVIINIGHIEEDPDKTLYLVRFEDKDLNLGPAVGCWPHEISSEAHLN